MTKVGIVIPCRNLAKYLRTAVESVVAQLYADWYLIVVDDASTDGTGDLVHTLQAEFPGRTIQLARSEKNIGLSAARNRGIECLDKCELILPLDADDWLHPDCLPQMLSCFDKVPELGIVHSARLNVGMAEGLIPAQIVHPSILPLQNQLGYCSMFRRDLWEKVGGYPDHFPAQGMEDWSFWIRCLKAGATFQDIANVLWYYRVRPGSMARTMDQEKALAGLIVDNRESYAPETVATAEKLIGGAA